MLLFLIVLAVLGILILVPPLMTPIREAEGGGRSAWRLVLETPALLVPALLAALSAWAATALASRRVSENPFDAGLDWPDEASFVLLVLMSMWVAGFVGLLKPIRDGHKPDGTHFWQGILDHSPAILLAKLLTCAILAGVGQMMRFGDLLGVLFMLGPSLVLAPVLGTTALHPRRPLRALRAVVERSRWDLRYSARLLIAQALIQFGIWTAFRRSAPLAREELPLLARDVTTLSFNPFPLLSHPDLGRSGTGGMVCLVAVSVITSTVFLLLHHRRVLDVPTRP